MGIVNVTPDSFSGDGLHATPTGSHDAGQSEAQGGMVARGVEHALRLLDEGAALLDLGAESTRPGSGAGGVAAISTAEEQDRLLPVLEALLRERPEAIVSVDTYRAATARAALAAGAEIVNDVSGFLWDPEMAATCAQQRCGIVLMHTRGRPDEWRTLPALVPEQVVPLVLAGLQERLQAADAAGIAAERIVLDPGYGFGKAFQANYHLLHAQPALLALGRPLLVGVSRKSFLGRTLAPLHGGADAPTHSRDNATIAASVAAVLYGASIVRVHAVRSMVEAAVIADAVLAGQIFQNKG
ncbi:dihydropteroate synthase [Acidipila sp. EB88]|nr:dihydropteroate synthase [Acidipila sp. EB88]